MTFQIPLAGLLGLFVFLETQVGFYEGIQSVHLRKKVRTLTLPQVI
jgi:hypothetical protein